MVSGKGETTGFWRWYACGISVMALLIASTPFSGSASANHTLTGCVYLANNGHWNEAVRQNTGANSEDGSSGYARINYPPGGPAAVGGGLVRSILLWWDADNWVEIAWSWARDVTDGPTKIAAWRDQGTYAHVLLGPAGDLNSYHKYRVVNDTGTHVNWFFDDVLKFNRTFRTLDQGNAAANSEVWNTCDSAYAHFNNLTELPCIGCGWDRWDGIVLWRHGRENPCYHTRLIDATEFYVEHGPGSGEVCIAPNDP